MQGRRRARRLAICALGLVACGSGNPPPAAPRGSPSVAPATRAAVASPAPAPVVPPPPPLPSFEALLARAPSLAAGMREVARGELTSGALPATREILRADAADTCVRVTLVAEPAVRAWLTDARGDVLAEVAATTDAPLGAKGPACVRKGDAITLRAEATSSFAVRFVAWASP